VTLTLCCWVLSATTLAGTVLVLLHLRATSAAQRPHWVAGAAHGVVGAAGLALLLVALRGPRRGVATGTSTFGVQAAVLLGAALVAGITIVVLSRRAAVGASRGAAPGAAPGAAAGAAPGTTRAIGGAMIVHSLLAVTGYALLLAYASLG